MEQSGSIDRRFLLGGLTGAAGVAALAAMGRAGPINPPAGAVGSTGKPIGEVEPRTAINAVNTPGNATAVFRITQPGSYYLTGNVTVPTNMPYGITVETDRVTIDLNGFSIMATGGANTFAGVLAFGGMSGAVVRNGLVRGFPRGLNLAIDALVEDVSIEASTNRGILASSRLIVRRCRLVGGLVGIECEGERALIEDCHISDFSGVGVYVNTSSVLRRVQFVGGVGGAFLGTYGLAESCTFAQHSTLGLDAAGGGCTVQGCMFAGCATGLKMAGACRAVGCSFDNNTVASAKIVGSSTLVESCTFSRSPIGVDMTGVSGNLVQRCTMLGVTSAVAVNVGGNWYPSVALGGVNGQTNPSASVFG